MRRLHSQGEVESLAFVVMPEHLHWLFVLGEKHDLSEVVRLLKGRSAYRVGRAAAMQKPLWQRAFFDHAVRREEDIRQLARYIMANPLRRGLVESMRDYSLWDALWVSDD